MSKGFRVTVEDLDRGESESMVVGAGDYMLIPFAPCYLHYTERSADGTVQITVKRHSPCPVESGEDGEPVREEHAPGPSARILATVDDPVRVALVTVLRRAHSDPVAVERITDMLIDTLVDPLRAMLMRSETEHVTFLVGPDRVELHPDWCRECRVDRWRRIAVCLAVAGDGSFRLLSTRDRDALEEAVGAYRQDAQDRTSRLAELCQDAADRDDPRGGSGGPP